MEFIKNAYDLKMYKKALSVKDNIRNSYLKKKVERYIADYELEDRVIDFISNNRKLYKKANALCVENYCLDVKLIGRNADNVYYVYDATIRIGLNTSKPYSNVGDDYHYFIVEPPFYKKDENGIDYWSLHTKRFLLELLDNQYKIDKICNELNAMTENNLDFLLKCY